MARKPLSKKKRFEVFKRDKFKCTYCGAAAPEAILHVDHIKPVSKGGTNSILNLTTSCVECNFGKGARELSDDSAVQKKRNQLEEMQERKELIDMMIDWELSLGDQYDQMIDGLEQIFQQTIKEENKVFTDSFRDELRKLCRKYPFKDLVDAMRDSFESYLKWDNEGITTPESQSKALDKIGNIAAINQEEKVLPGVKKIGLVYSSMKRSFNYVPAYWVVAREVRKTLRCGVPIDEIQSWLTKCSNWTQFETALQEFPSARGYDHG